MRPVDSVRLAQLGELADFLIPGFSLGDGATVIASPRKKANRFVCAILATLSILSADCDGGTSVLGSGDDPALHDVREAQGESPLPFNADASSSQQLDSSIG